MNSQEKLQALIQHFGSVEEYQKQVFDKIPPMFVMVMDEQGNVTADQASMMAYIKKEMETGISFDDLLDRETKRFEQIVDELYQQTFA